MGRHCIKCQQELSPVKFITIHSELLDNVMPICRDCVKKIFESAENKEAVWNMANKLCQLADIPFVPEAFQEAYEENGANCFGSYCYMFKETPYNTYDWGEYNQIYLDLAEKNKIARACPTINEEERKEKIQKWGSLYTDEELDYLENLYQGILASSSIVGALNEDQVLKLCKISLIIENKILTGVDISKDLRSYDDLCKLAGVSSEMIKEGSEFSSTGEVFAYLEKQGYKVKYYDGAINDEVDKTIRDIQYWQRYMYLNETGIAEEIQERINGLKTSDAITGEDFDWDEYQRFADSVDENDTFEIEV